MLFRLNEQNLLRIAVFVVLLWNFGCDSYSCGSGPEDLMKNMEELVAEIEMKDYSPKSSRWEKYDNQFRYFYDECFDLWESEMKRKDKRRFARLAGRYITIRYGRSFFKNLFRGEDATEEDEVPEYIQRMKNILDMDF